MKIFCLICTILTFSSNLALAQKSEVIIDSVDNKAVIFSKSLIWINNTWKNAKEVIQLKDEESGTIIVKGGLSAIPITMGVPANGITKTQLTIRVKDGKAKLEFDNTYFDWQGGTVWTTEKKPSMYGKSYDRWLNTVLKEMDNLIQSYKDYLTKKTDDF